MREISYHPIGIIHSPFRDLVEMPIQPTGDASASGRIEIFPEFAEGLKDLEGFSHLILIYHFHCTGSTHLTITPFLDDHSHGVFATRAPSRPNPIGLSVIRLESIQDNVLMVNNLDILDGTPLLDIKPYIPEFDQSADVRIGWLEKAKGKVKLKKADNRFA